MGMRFGHMLLATCVAFLAAGAPLQARIVAPVHGGTPCVNTCKEPWRVCFREICFATPGYKNAPAAKRAVIEDAAKSKCAPEWARFQACKRLCKDRAEMPQHLTSLRPVPGEQNYCPL
jgi:hypothetical protein